MIQTCHWQKNRYIADMLSGGDVPLVLFYVTKMIIEDAA
jgi:hypothetical protein